MRVVSMLIVALLLVVIIWGAVGISSPEWATAPTSHLVSMGSSSDVIDTQDLEINVVRTLSHVKREGRIAFVDLDSNRLMLDLILPERSTAMLWHDLWALGHDVFLELPMKELWVRVFVQEHHVDQNFGKQRLWMATVLYRPERINIKKPEPWGETMFRQLFSAEVQWVP